jgi:3-hydroxybutyryl-CoA dehydrogenase
MLAASDGRPASAIARDAVVYDLALDYRTCTRLAVARGEGCSDAGYAAAVGALQAAGIAVSRIGDVAGLVVMRTVAMLANEAADAVNQSVASARDVDLAMRNGVNYPLGPLAWADRIGLAHVRAVLANLSAHYGDPRYRTSPMIARHHALTDE